MTRTLLGIGAAARALGTTERTLRYYEERGLLSPTDVTAAGRRRYDATALRRAEHLLSLRDLGLTLATMQDVLKAGDGADLTAILTERAERLDSQISDLQLLRSRVSKALDASLGSDLLGVTLDLLEEIAMQINLTRIYTRTGDDGTTALAHRARVGKDDARLEAMGDVDELVSAIGVAIAAGNGRHTELLQSIQNDLFDLGADLASITNFDESTAALVGPDYLTRLEQKCDEINAKLAPPASFVLPGNNLASAALHHARAICRRAERRSWGTRGAPEEDCRYLNRLADLLFILARATETEPEPTWTPRSHQPTTS